MQNHKWKDIKNIVGLILTTNITKVEQCENCAVIRTTKPWHLTGVIESVNDYFKVESNEVIKLDARPECIMKEADIFKLKSKKHI